MDIPSETGPNGEVNQARNVVSFSAGRKRRVYLFLQGHPSPLWKELFLGLSSAGAECRKINLCLADSAFWLGVPSTAYRGSLTNWPIWLEEYCRQTGVTDILYYADQHPYHCAAREMSRLLGISCWAIEFGYLRPDWITLERDGMGPLSHFPKSPDRIGVIAATRPTPDLTGRYLHRFGDEAAREVLFNLLMVFGRPAFPRYVSDKPFWPVLEYLGWLPVLAMSGRDRRQAVTCERELSKKQTPYNLVAMQMRGDYQIRAASRFADLVDFVDEVLTSFSRNAPADRQIVFKMHPLESGYHVWGRKIRRLARRHGVLDRISVIRGGDLHRLLKQSNGTVLVNSTVGIHSLRLGVPTCAMGEAIYGLPGLAHQSGLDTFWTRPDPVDGDFFALFERALTALQVKGSFFDPEGRRKAVAEIVVRLTENVSPLLLVDQNGAVA